MRKQSVTIAAGTAVLLWAASAFAQMPNPYGPSITLDAARKAAAPALAEAQKNNWRMAVAVVDISGDLVFFEKMDGTQAASVAIAQDKARSSARFKRPTKALQDGIAQGGGNLRLLAVKGLYPLEGGVPIVVDGKIIGAIGASGVMANQDAEVAMAGAAAAK